MSENTCKKCGSEMVRRKTGYYTCRECFAEYMRNKKGFKKRVLTTIESINDGKPTQSRLTAINFTKKIKRQHGRGFKQYAIFKCICGKEVELYIHDVKHGCTLSCGCLMGDAQRVYVGNIPAINNIYNNMLSRCYDPDNMNYKYYGGAGVVVCEEWKNNYQSFLDWMKGNGWKTGLQLDKDIKGNGKLYSPASCILVTRLENLEASGVRPRDQKTGRFLKTGKYE